MTQSMDEYDKAMAVLSDLAKEYETWVLTDLANLKDTFKRACGAPEVEQDKLFRENLFRIAHDMNGQGATFGYDLVTDIGNHLCRYIERQSTFDASVKQKIKMHIDAIEQVLQSHLTGSGGEQGQALWQRIEALL